LINGPHNTSKGWDVINDVSLAIIDMKESYDHRDHGNYWEKEAWVELIISTLAGALAYFETSSLKNWQEVIGGGI
jgi:hypothetical protein